MIIFYSIIYDGRLGWRLGASVCRRRCVHCASCFKAHWIQASVRSLILLLIFHKSFALGSIIHPSEGKARGRRPSRPPPRRRRLSLITKSIKVSLINTNPFHWGTLLPVTKNSQWIPFDPLRTTQSSLFFDDGGRDFLKFSMLSRFRMHRLPTYLGLTICLVNEIVIHHS